MKYPGGNMSTHPLLNKEEIRKIISEIEHTLVKLEREYRENYSGSFKIIHLRGKPYIYRCFKKNGKWKTKYIGKGDEKKLEQLKKHQHEVRMKIEKYRKIVKLLRELYETL